MKEFNMNENLRKKKKKEICTNTHKNTYACMRNNG